jgi:hypothetical protein
VDIPEGDYRALSIAMTAVVLVVCALLGLALLIRPKTPFERKQAVAEASNPKWLKVEITTSDSRHEYRASEFIFVVAHFSSTVPYQYKIDIADGFSTAAATDELRISNGHVRMLNERNSVCCSSRLVGLDSAGFTAPSTPLRLAPGEYEIYLTSRRVFEWDVDKIRAIGAEEDYPSPFEVASNMLKLHVVGDPAHLRR